jgi:very-short-patch-repair endonuclease
MPTLAQSLRGNPTDAERRLWRALRLRQLNVKFRRQVPIAPYVVDFLSFEHRLIVEADGGQHADSEHDARRDAWLRSQGFRILRFWNNDILANTEGVVITILEALNETPSPLAGEGRGGGAPAAQ